MKFTSKTVTAITILNILFFLVVKAHASPLIFHDQKYENIEEAVASISNELNAKHFTISLTVDHSAAAAGVGLALRPTTVIFARQPKALEFLTLRRSDTIGIDLPMKILVFEDAQGDVQVRSNSTGYLIDRHEAKIFDLVWNATQRIDKKFLSSDQGLVTIASQNTLDETVLRLTNALSANPNFRIPLTLDFCDERAWQQCPRLIVFGNPNVGTPLMQASQEVAIDLPQKFLVWEKRWGEVFITYNDPFFIAKRHAVEGQDTRLQAIANALASFAEQGASRP